MSGADMGSCVDKADHPVDHQPARLKSTGDWRPAIRNLALCWLVILSAFWRDTADMVSIWWNSSTFNHCLLILPILWWLVEQRREELAKLTPQPWAMPLIWLAAGAGSWMLGDAAGLALARHLGLAMLLQGSVALLLGPAITRGLLFPLFYMLFLVPFGEELVPPLQTLTAEMCMWLLGLTGISAHLDGIYISTPAALFRVAEACSGVKFLIAMVALGALIANICFSSPIRRMAFMAACIVIPILANGLRAFGTIYIAQHGNVEFAASFDHVVYGWIFFGIVIALVMAAGWPFFDRAADARPIDAIRLQNISGRSLTARAALAAAGAIIILPLLWSSYIANRESPVPDQIALPEIAGWQRVDYRPAYPWQPRFVEASHTLLGRYRNGRGQEADLYIAVYDRQSEGRELIGFGQGAEGLGEDWSWIEACPSPQNAKCERISSRSQYKREVLSFYRAGGVTSGSSARIKLATAKARLLGGDQQAVAILVSAEQQGKQSPRPAIDAFVKSLGDIDKLADRMAGLD